MSVWPEDIAEALRRHEVVAITSGITDLREATELLDRALPDRWARIEWGMGSALNRSRFHDMQQRSGFHMLPMFVTRDAVIGGTTELRSYLDKGRATPPAAVPGAASESISTPPPCAPAMCLTRDRPIPLPRTGFKRMSLAR